MRNYQPLVTENGNSGNGVHALRVQEANVLGHIVDVGLVRPQQRVLEGNVDRAIAVFNVKNNRVAACIMPAPDDLYAVIASCH